MRESPEDKLRDANKELASAIDHPAVIGSILVNFHAALENRLRELLVIRLPLQRDEIYSNDQTNWPKLIDYSKEYLGLSFQDGEKIYNTNKQRNFFTHGPRKDFNMTLPELRSYAQLVNKLFASLPSQPYQQPRYTEPPPVIRIPTPPPEIVPPPTRSWNYSPYREKPWYRSTIFYVFLFLMFLPGWAFWILTDRDQGWFAKTFAILVLGFCLLMAACFVGFLILSFSSAFQQVY